MEENKNLANANQSTNGVQSQPVTVNNVTQGPTPANNVTQGPVVGNTPNKGNKNSRLFIIIGLFVVVLVAGYIVYTQFIKKDNNQEPPINQEPTSSSEISGSTDESINSNGLFNRVYQYFSTDNKKLLVIIFNDDGTFYMLDSMECSSGYSGNYTSNNNLLTLVSKRYYSCDECYYESKPENHDITPDKTFEINYIQDDKLTYNDGNELITLSRATYDETMYENLTNDNYRISCSAKNIE